MIAILLRDLRARLVMVLAVAAGLLLWELESREHGAFEGAEMEAIGLGAPMAYLASISMIILLGGFISRDRREGFTRIYFSYATSPLAFYGVRWLLAYLLTLAAAVLFSLVVQLAVWGSVRGGFAALVLPALTGLIFGGIVAFFSSILPRGDAWMALILLLPTLFPQVLTLLLSGAPPAIRESAFFLLPPQTTALQRIYEQLLLGGFAWGPMAFAAGYGLVWIVAAVLVLRIREWP